jgi:homopolymeric O-antigen transport system permease protein
MIPKKYIELIWYKALAELKAEAARAYIGFLWWVLEPLLYMSAFYIAFGTGVRRGGVHFLAYLLTGLVPWKWFASTVINGSIAIQANSALIQQVYIPKYVLPWIVVVVNTIKFSIILSLLIVLLCFTGHSVGIAWLALPVVIAVQFMVIISITSFFAALVPLFPELKLIVDNGIIVLMFLSGIFFNIDTMPARLAAVLRVNPMVEVIESFRNIFLNNAWPDWAGLSWCIILSLILYTVAGAILRKYDRFYVKLMIG